MTSPKSSKSLNQTLNTSSLDHTSFTVLSVSTKHIESTDRISVTLSKNSARSFYLGKEKTNTPQTIPYPLNSKMTASKILSTALTSNSLILKKRSYTLALKIKQKLTLRVSKLTSPFSSPLSLSTPPMITIKPLLLIEIPKTPVENLLLKKIPD